MRRLAYVSMILTAAMLLLSGCNASKRMHSNVGRITAVATPDVVTLKDGKAVVDVTLTFPPKYFYENMELKLTPVLVYENGEIAGTPKYVMGEDVKENYHAISWRHGGEYTTTLEVPYDPRASVSVLELRVEGRNADKCVRGKRALFAPYGAIVVAPGVAGTKIMAEAFYWVAPHGYQKVKTYTKNADFYFNVNRTNVTTKEAQKQQIMDFESFIKEYSAMPNATVSTVHTKGWASPEGTVANNNRLADGRALNGEKEIVKALKNITATYDHKGYGEDWAGFEKLVRESNIEGKEHVLELIAMHSDVNVREAEIKKLSSTYSQIRKEILPPLRRAEFTVSADVEGREMDAIVLLAKQGDQTVGKDEYLYAASIAKNAEERIAILRGAAKNYDCAMVSNNLAVALAERGEYAEAATYIKKALEMHPEDKNIIANAARIAAMQEDYTTARGHLQKVNADEFKDVHGLIFLKEGNHEMAAKYVDGYNLALLEMSKGNYAAAKRAITGNDAKSDYLRATLAMREGNRNDAARFLESAIDKDPALEARASEDVDFVEIIETVR